MIEGLEFWGIMIVVGCVTAIGAALRIAITLLAAGFIGYIVSLPFLIFGGDAWKGCGGIMTVILFIYLFINEFPFMF